MQMQENQHAILCKFLFYDADVRFRPQSIASKQNKKRADCRQFYFARRQHIKFTEILHVHNCTHA